jgi:hypothetical protein
VLRDQVCSHQIETFGRRELPSQQERIHIAMRHGSEIMQMHAPQTNTPPPLPARSRAAIQVFRPDNPYVALGLAVNHLMTMPAFANLRFGEWSRVLVGQINREHFCFVADDKNQIRGFLGWALTSKEHAEAWVQGRGGLSYKDSLHGDCVIFNAPAKV